MQSTDVGMKLLSTEKSGSPENSFKSVKHFVIPFVTCGDIFVHIELCLELFCFRFSCYLLHCVIFGLSLNTGQAFKLGLKLLAH
jgi:hypothetical protein